MDNVIHPPRHLVWSTDRVDMDDPFQRRWYLRQILTHGTDEDIRSLDWIEVAQEIDSLNLSAEIERLWHAVLAPRDGK